MNESITNQSKIVEALARFCSYVREQDQITGDISFHDSASYLGREEDYKSVIAVKAREKLELQSWEENWIGTGKIAECAKNAINKAANLVNMNQMMDFKNRLDSKNVKFCPEAERVLYDIYRNPFCSEEVAFNNAIKAFGAKYDTISFLFFLKDDTRFLPISVGHFDRAFSLLDIDYTTSSRCGWENYQGYIDIIQSIRNVMEEVLPMQGKPRLIDAHSFVWVIQEQKFIDWVPNVEQRLQIEQDTESALQRIVTGTAGRYIHMATGYKRSAAVVKETRRRAKGICQFCNQPAPFEDNNGEPYLETHHVIWLSRGGEDSTANTVALCPNCHTRLHVLDKPEDIDKLLRAISLLNDI